MCYNTIVAQIGRDALMEKKKSFVYILHCADDTLYTGYTTDLDRRLKEHQMGSKKCKYTMAKIRRPVEMVSSWEIEGPRGHALRIEAFIKKLSKKKKQELITSPNVLKDWFFTRTGDTILCEEISKTNIK